MYRKLLTYICIFTTVLLTSCSANFGMPDANGIGPDGMVQLTFDVPSLTTVTTRAVDPEFKVNDITVIIYSGENTIPAQTEHIYLDNSKNDKNKILTELEGNQLLLSFKINQDIRNKELIYYFIANYDDENLQAKTIASLKSDKVSDAIGVVGSFVMCGSTTSNNGTFTDSPIPLYRNVVKVSVTDGEGADATVPPYQVFGMANSSILLAGIENSLSNAISPSSYPVDLEAFDVSYYHPTENVDDDTNAVMGNIFVITKASYEGNDYFYRMDFCKKDADGNVNFLNAQANHWYQFIIQEIKGTGYPTPEEASMHPDSDIVYEIHDHSSRSYNMISDGIRELGVSHAITYNGTTDEYLYIKVFSKIESEMNDDNLSEQISLVSEASWLTFGDIEEVTDESELGTNGVDGDHNDAGRLFRVPLNFAVGSGTLTTSVAVTWMGLQRSVPVVSDIEFNGAAISSAALTINYKGIDTSIEDYWVFLSSTDNGSATGSDVLWGVQKEPNNGKIRNQGFHFPVMYGENGAFATYSYNLNFNKDEKFNSIESVKITSTDNNVTITETAGTGHKEFTITRSDTDRYAYVTGKISFAFKFINGSTEVYSFDTYHTGFFHKDDNEYRLDINGKDPAYYYYEVLPIDVDGKTRYILDRNLAAKSAQDYIRGANGEVVSGTEDAAGGYYYVAYQDQFYEDPVMYKVSPPGYRIPDRNEWGAIRTSSSFHIDFDGTIYPAYYNTSVGRTYFPKAMMYLSGNVTGEGRSGYYWTRTPSSGSEKEEIGRWLNMLVMAGSTTTYYNGYVLVGDDKNAAYGCSVRCINDEEDTTDQVNRTNFMVAGATHVFLYKEENGERIAPTTWPGKAVFNFATANAESWAGFEYSSSQFSPEDMYVVFNFVDQAGIIHTFSKDENGNTIYTSDVSPKVCQGWKVIGDDSESIIPTGTLQADGVPLSPAKRTALGNWWQCNSNATDKMVKDYKRDKYLYLIGDVFEGFPDWEPNNGVPVRASEDNEAIFIWEGQLKLGAADNSTFKAYWNNDASSVNAFWNQPFFRPAINGTFWISASGISQCDMKFTYEPSNSDYKWGVRIPGKYKLTFNVENMKFYAEYTGEKIRITCNNVQNWPSVYLYWWNGDINNKWPGTLMNNDPDNYNSWYLDIPAEAQNVIFNDGGNRKTPDLECPGEDGYNYNN